MLKTQITGAKYLSPQTNQMTNLNIAVPADSKDTEFGTSDIMLAKDTVNLIEDKEDLKSQFKPLLDNLFLNRNSSILSKDSEGLKSFYNLDKKTGQWAYENETKKIKYFSNWCEKQGASFSRIKSIYYC